MDIQHGCRCRAISENAFHGPYLEVTKKCAVFPCDENTNFLAQSYCNPVFTLVAMGFLIYAISYVLF